MTSGMHERLSILATTEKLAVTWHSADGKLVKSAPSHVKKAFPKEVRSVASLAKELEQVYLAQRNRLESSFVLPRGMPVAHWRQYFVEHPLLGFLGRRLIWVFRNEQGWERSGIWSGAGRGRRVRKSRGSQRRADGAALASAGLRCGGSSAMARTHFRDENPPADFARRFASSTKSRRTSARPECIPIDSPKS